MKTLKQILGGRNLTGVIQTVAPGIPNPLPAAFFTMTQGIEGNSGTYTKVEGTRKLARLIQHGAESRSREMKGISEQPVILLTLGENIRHSPKTMENLLQPNSEARQRLGQNEIGRQTGVFKSLFSNTRIAAVIQALSLGYLYFDVDGNLLPSATNAFTTVDFGIPAGNRNQLDVFGAGAIIDAGWNTAATDISGQIIDLKKAALQKTGYPITTAYYGENILGYFLKNTTMKELINRHAGRADAAAAGDLPQGLLGLTWIPMYSAFFEDPDDTIQDLWSADKVVFTPTIERSWYELLEGSNVIPTNIYNIRPDAIAALRDFMIATGMYSYAYVTMDPAGIKHVAGDCFLPVIKVPGAVFIADVEFAGGT